MSRPLFSPFLSLFPHSIIHFPSPSLSFSLPFVPFFLSLLSLSLPLSLSPSISLSLFLSLNLTIYLSVYLSMNLPISLSIYVFVYLSVSLSLSDPLVGTTLVALVNVIATYVALKLMDTTARRTLILLSTGGMIISTAFIIAALSGLVS